MVKVGKWIAKHRVIVLILALLLTIPSAIGVVKTRVNYDLLSYLPDTSGDGKRPGYSRR